MNLNFIDNHSKQLVLFDMDGVLAEYVAGEEKAICNEIDGVYFNKRPLKTIIELAEQMAKQENVTVGILSSCEFKSQEKEKLDWLQQYAPFVDKTNIYIIVWSEEDYTRETRKYAKLEVIEKIKGYDKIFLIEDKHDIIKTANSKLLGVAHHISELIK
jgi:hypothetical protein